MNEPAPLNSSFLFHLTAEMSPSQKFGAQILAPIEGGTVAGPNMEGHVLPGGGDWLTLRPKGIALLDVRLTIKTHDEALIYMSASGRRVVDPAVMETLATFDDWAALDPSGYYVRLLAIFETGDARYERLNGIVSVGIVRFTSEGVAFDLHEIL